MGPIGYPIRPGLRRARTGVPSLGLPVKNKSAFDLDPEIKRECTWSGPVARPAAC